MTYAISLQFSYIEHVYEILGIKFCISTNFKFHDFQYLQSICSHLRYFLPAERNSSFARKWKIFVSGRKTNCYKKHHHKVWRKSWLIWKCIYDKYMYICMRTNNLSFSLSMLRHSNINDHHWLFFDMHDQIY